MVQTSQTNKSNGWDNLSVRMIKLCSKSIIYPLKIIFEASLQKGTFPSCWKKANVVPVHKKEDRNLIKNCRPISLLPILGKIFERIVFKDLFNYFHKNNFFYRMSAWTFTRWFLHLTVATYCSWYQFFFWLWSNYWCQRCILRYFKGL